MITGDKRGGVLELLELIDGMDIALVSVEYRLAPETPHPGPVEDCYAGLLWTADHVAELGIDPARIIVAGASTNGGLAAALAMRAGDRSGPALLAQLLMYPMLDDRNDTPSAHQMAGLGVWTAPPTRRGWSALLGDSRGTDIVPPYAAPARVTDLSGLPPAFLDVGPAETFRDEVVTYASRIWQAGGHAELYVWAGAFYGFDLPPDAVSQNACAARGP
ncbi:alpha/beta hydrolase [Streptomyces sp. NPDC056053]|uniref:alpha/beta hydrolase n=1 Tax=Streptomyces sp. NPDC056053 TaxID=3345696 RepID=UPI0035DC90AC